jgi:hypothetical protein
MSLGLKIRDFIFDCDLEFGLEDIRHYYLNMGHYRSFYAMMEAVADTESMRKMWYHPDREEVYKFLTRLLQQKMGVGDENGIVEVICLEILGGIHRQYAGNTDQATVKRLMGAAKKWIDRGRDKGWFSQEEHFRSLLGLRSRG